MTRGTTPTHTFTLPFAAGDITLLNIAYAQRGEIVLEKDLNDCTVSDNTLSVTLSEQDTLMFDASDSKVEIQLRAAVGERRLASEIITTTARRILKDGEL